ncbi:Dihydropteroate synthase [Vibrio aerogenes CECT 7868]|uniref:Dihydropteroate synthase n=1 Tax=Vibrio aerogenes CECT 7868 TaxID=1216006 RepID=A0A1M5YB26_9VIBR|nr:dihydropteroate synthase [Vibrio aerogenes]SHI09054.1 Dihydropteroate synthase [Vibrio aerogenes CECT 7868]
MKIQTSSGMLDLSYPHVMGILNTTPDSFSDGGKYYDSTEKAMAHAESMIRAGASIIDVGGESTRPGAADVSLEEELSRVVPVVKALKAKYKICVSVDTSKAGVMKQAVEAGADLINDVRALQEPGAIDIAADANIPVCLMHMRGNPKNMQSNTSYDNIFDEVCIFLRERIEVCLQKGIRQENIILDPGFGFGKSLEHNYHLLANFEKFHELGYPLLAGLSRKSMFYKYLNKAPEACTISSVVGASLAILKGAHIVRVHDVEQTVEAMKIIQMIKCNQ